MANCARVPSPPECLRWIAPVARRGAQFRSISPTADAAVRAAALAPERRPNVHPRVSEAVPLIDRPAPGTRAERSPSSYERASAALSVVAAATSEFSHARQWTAVLGGGFPSHRSYAGLLHGDGNERTRFIAHDWSYQAAIDGDMGAFDLTP